MHPSQTGRINDRSVFLLETNLTSWQEYQSRFIPSWKAWRERELVAICYKAGSWINVGQTKGRGKIGPAGKISVPIRDIRVYPLIVQERKPSMLLCGTRVWKVYGLVIGGQTMSGILIVDDDFVIATELAETLDLLESVDVKQVVA